MKRNDRISQIARISAMDRETLMRSLRMMRYTFKMDFSREYLASLEISELRHIVLAASSHRLRTSA